MSKKTYELGRRNGYYDASMNISLQVARHNPDTGYAQGYRDGQAEYSQHGKADEAHHAITGE